MGHGAYMVNLDGSGRVSNRNRRFLHKITPFTALLKDIDKTTCSSSRKEPDKDIDKTADNSSRKKPPKASLGVGMTTDSSGKGSVLPSTDSFVPGLDGASTSTSTSGVVPVEAAMSSGRTDLDGGRMSSDCRPAAVPARGNRRGGSSRQQEVWRSSSGSSYGGTRELPAWGGLARGASVYAGGKDNKGSKSTSVHAAPLVRSKFGHSASSATLVSKNTTKSTDVQSIPSGKSHDAESDSTAYNSFLNHYVDRWLRETLNEKSQMVDVPQNVSDQLRSIRVRFEPKKLVVKHGGKVMMVEGSSIMARYGAFCVPGGRGGLTWASESYRHKSPSPHAHMNAHTRMHVHACTYMHV